ncbi:MAG TPA: hypothetical protein PLC99_12625 [Verrucomicrobiota bacterium]|nr:hypothetical protein [Verrucomicrobiota bacterium]
MKCLGLGSLAALLLVSGAGCKKSPSEAARPSVAKAPPATIARVHWVGKQHIVTGKSTNYLVNAWALPRAERLEAQTLDKLALALTGEQPAGFTNILLVISNQLTVAGSPPAGTNLPTQVVISNQPVIASHQLAGKLRPLLHDLLRQECYAQIQHQPNQSAELALAVRLDAPRAELWSSNLTAVLGAMTNAQSLPAPAGRLAWRLPLAPPRPSRLDLARAGDWTLLGLAGETNVLLAELAQRVLTAPPGLPATNNWLDVDVDLRRVSSALSLGWKLPDSWPRVAASWAAKAGFVRTAGQLTFPQPLNLQLEPWNIPTNLIREPLVSFAAIRGVRSWLAGLSWLKKFQIESPPNQFCAWASTAAPTPSFAAAPLTNAAALLRAIGPQIQAEYNPWVTNNAFGALEFAKEPLCLRWTGIPMFSPMLEAYTASGGDFLLARLGPKPPEKSPPAPAELFAQLTTRTNLVYYDWEITPAKVNHWVYLGQTARLALYLPQMQPSTAAYGLLLEVGPSLGNSGTEVIQDGPASLSFLRNSQLGFTGSELHLLADWLESPAFPRGFRSLLAPKPQKVRRGKLGTNAIPARAMAPQRPANAPAPPR